MLHRLKLLFNAIQLVKNMTNIAKMFGARVKALREARDMTQSDLAKKARGLTCQYVSSVERGATNPTLANIDRIAKGLGVDPIALFVFGGSSDDISPAAAYQIMQAATPKQARRLARVIAVVLD